MEGKSIFVWGKGAFIPKTNISENVSEDEAKPVQLSQLAHEHGITSIRQVACGCGFTVLVTGDGEVVTFGANNWYQSGGSASGEIAGNVHKWDKTYFGGAKVVEVSAGEAFAAALTEKGELYTWGTGESGQLGLGHLDKTIVAVPTKVALDDVATIACGNESAAAVTTSGDLYTWGNGACGVLGHGDDKNLFEPRQVKELEGIRVIQIKAGASHMTALTELGIYTWGNNFLGPLGRILGKGKDNDALPKPIDLVQTGATVSEENLKGSDEVAFKQIECLKYNSIALSTDGQVFSCGKGGFDGGGHGDSPHTLFCLIEAIKDVNITAVASSMTSHTAAIADNGDIYVWGNGENGQLGLGDTQNRSLPTKNTLLENKQILAIACGDYHTVAISALEPAQPEHSTTPVPELTAVEEEEPKTEAAAAAVETPAASPVVAKLVAAPKEESVAAPATTTTPSVTPRSAESASSSESSPSRSPSEKKDPVGAMISVTPIDGDAEKQRGKTVVNNNNEGACEGWLKKKGDKGLIKGWKRRYFVVEGSAINYYEKKGDKSSYKGCIAVADIVDIMEGQVKFGFNVVSRTKRVYELQADNQEDFDKWVPAIKALMRR